MLFLGGYALLWGSMEWYWIVSFVAVGLGAGLLSGLLGISGGIVTVPCLLLIFKEMGLSEEYLMHMAVGTSLSAMSFNSFASMLAHHRRGGIIWEAIGKMLPGLLVGVGLGSFIADLLSSGFLQSFFGGFELLVGLYFLWPVKARDEGVVPSWWTLSGCMLVVSGLSTMLGIGGGLVVTPLLVFLGFDMRKSIGTAAGASFLVCVFGAVSYLVLGLTSGVHLEDCIGYIHFPSFLIISLSAPFAAVIGAYLTHQLSVKLLRKIFGIALIVAGVALLW